MVLLVITAMYVVERARARRLIFVSARMVILAINVNTLSAMASSVLMHAVILMVPVFLPVVVNVQDQVTRVRNTLASNASYPYAMVETLVIPVHVQRPLTARA